MFLLKMRDLLHHNVIHPAYGVLLVLGLPGLANAVHDFDRYHDDGLDIT